MFSSIKGDCNYIIVDIVFNLGLIYYYVIAYLTFLIIAVGRRVRILYTGANTEFQCIAFTNYSLNENF